ncbi:hypothetical protein ACHQM5_014532 [Ranunculus cassubicifolius]
MPRAKDKIWTYGEDLHGRFICNFCKKNYSGGASRLKVHLSCLSGRDISGCTLVPEDVQAQAMLMVGGDKASKKQKVGPSSPPVEAFGGTPSLHQVTLPNMCDKKDKESVDMKMAFMFVDNNIAFNVVQTPSFLSFCKGVAEYGSGYVVPSYSTLRTKLVQNLKDKVVEYVDSVKKFWSDSGSGCTLMSDGWTDLKGRSFINMIAYSPKGAVFLKCYEASKDRKTGEFLMGLLCNAIEIVGSENVVQIITDNASNYESAGELVMLEYPHIYKGRCATHGVQLLLKDIDATIGWIKELHNDAKNIVDFIYRYPTVTALFREKSGDRELKKPCTTRFAYNFLMVQSIIELEEELRIMVASSEWRSLKHSRLEMGKEITHLIQGITFWSNAREVVSVVEPLIRVLRLVDGEGSTAGYLYEAMERVRENIKQRCDNDETRYLELWNLFDSRRETNIVNIQHALAAFLNPKFMLSGRVKYEDIEVKKGLIFVVTKMLATVEERRAFSTQITQYNTRNPEIFTFIANHQIETIHPRVWWSQNGGLIPVVQKVAIRLLSQPCSASACERNWSAFEAAQTKKRNKLSPEMLEDLVYIRMNSKMKDKAAALEVQDAKAIDLEQLGELAEYEDHDDVDEGNQDSAPNSADPSTSNTDPINVVFEELFGRD